MTRLFVSFYLFVAIALVLISSILELVLPNERYEKTREALVLETMLPLVTSDRSSLIERLRATGVDYEIKSINSIGWSDAERHSFANKRAITLFDEEAKYIYAPIGNDEFIALTLPYEKVSTPYLIVYLFVFLVLLGLAMAVWLRPLWRDLSHITREVSHLGQESEVLSISLKKRSIMQPIANRLNLLSDRVHSLLRDQRELTGAVAHEFRTPIARLKFALEMNPNPNSEAWNGILADIDELESLVQEMLDYTQYDAVVPELSISDIPTKELCENLVERLSLTTGKSLTVIGENLLLRGDGHFVERAVSNLLTNAIRHAHNKVVIEIRSNPETVTISVSDDGDGVAENLAERIFEPFYRPDNSRVRYSGGAGLGLAIVQRIQLWHKGTASVKPSRLGGACFVLTYPK
ncbi:ATP-binding protein [Alteromonas sp. S015]|uniref:ATP-binding protein n=1 Tax=Alteromonas sp. S015 TaxID=3117401 RepID=UPI002FDFAC19